MSCEADVFKINKKLDEIIKLNNDSDTSLDLLNTLNSMPLTLEVLQKTRIGMTVNSLRKSTKNDQISNLAKHLIKKWKKLLTDQNANKERKSSSSSEKINANGNATLSNDYSLNGTLNNNSSPSNSQDSLSSFNPAFSNSYSVTNDPVRLKCQSLILNALTYDDMPYGRMDIKEIAVRCEDAIFKEFGNTEMKYKTRVRSKVANLKDTKNPKLRENVLLGHIAPERLAVMTPEEMASDEMKKLRQQYTKEGINDHQMSTITGTPTDLFKCSKCKGKNCTYTQIQTRSSDEPMTTFVYCIDCGNRWKFS